METSTTNAHDGTMPNLDFAAIREQASIMDVLNALDFEQTRTVTNNQVRGVCPLCGSNGFIAMTTNNVWYCFACKNSGGVIDLWMQARNIGIKEAASQMCTALNLDVPFLGNGLNRVRST